MATICEARPKGAGSQRPHTALNACAAAACRVSLPICLCLPVGVSVRMCSYVSGTNMEVKPSFRHRRQSKDSHQLQHDM